MIRRSRRPRRRGRTRNPRYDNNRFGGNFGGPIIKNKLFFFTDWEYNPMGQAGTPSTGCAPTSAGYAMLASLFPGNTQLQQLQKYVPAGGGTANVCDPTINVAPGFQSNGTTNGNATSQVSDVSIFPMGDVGFIGPSYSNYAEHRQLVRLQHFGKRPVALAAWPTPRTAVLTLRPSCRVLGYHCRSATGW